MKRKVLGLLIVISFIASLLGTAVPTRPAAAQPGPGDTQWVAQPLPAGLPAGTQISSGPVLVPDGVFLTTFTPPGTATVFKSPTPVSSTSWQTLFITGLVPGSTGAFLGVPPAYATNQTLYLFDRGVGGNVYRSADGGATWVTRPAPSATFVCASFALQDANIGYLCDSAGNIYKTTDGAQTWTGPFNAGVGNVRQLLARDNSLFVGGTGKIAYSNSGGPPFTIVNGNPGEGYRMVLDGEYATNNTIYLGDASGSSNVTYRLKIGTDPAPVNLLAPNTSSAVLALAHRSGALYSFHANLVDRTLNPLGTAGPVTWRTMDSPPGLLSGVVTGTVNTIGSSNIAYARGVVAGSPQLWAYSDYLAIAKPLLVSPASGSTVDPAQLVTLAWNPMGTGTGQVNTYQVQITETAVGWPGATTSGNIPVIPPSPMVTMGPTGQFVFTLLPGKTYQWRVRASNQASGDAINSNWSDPFTLVTASPAQNQVFASFDTNYTYSTLADSVGNITTRQAIGLSSNLRNQTDATGQAVDDSILNLSTTQTVTSVYSPDYFVPGSTYRWQFPDIGENQNFNGGGNIAQMVDFTTGFTASRSVNQRRFPTTGGTQILTLSVTPKEPMERLEVSGNTIVDGLDIATVTAVSGDNITINPDTKRFNARVENPVVDHLYQWQVTIQVAAPPADFLALEYMPQITVRNADITASGNLPGSSLARSTVLGNWTWQANGSYSWNWEEKLNKQVNFQGYAVQSFVTAPTQETINQSIDKGLAWLRTQQHPDGSWYWGRPARPNSPAIPEAPNVGMTGLSVWSLLHGLVPQTDPVVSSGIDFLLSKQVTNTTDKDYGAFRSDQNGQPVYETSLVILALRATNNPVYLPQMRLAADYLAKAQNDEGVVYPHFPGGITSSNWAYGGWGYRYASESNQMSAGGVQLPMPWFVWSDLSNTQFAMIAMKAAQEAGVTLNHDSWANVWAKAATFVTRCQYSDGGFGYQPQDSSYGGSYGLATGAGVWCLRLSGAPTQDPRIQAGLAWLDARPFYDRNPQSNQYEYYYLWSAAKAFTLTNRPPVLTPGTWYYNFAGYLVAYQPADGQWVNPVWPEGESNLNATHYALLVLEKAVLPPPPGIDSIKIEHMRIEFDTKPNSDKIKILKARFKLNEDASYDLSEDDVVVTIDDVVITIPAGSFVKDHKQGSWQFYSDRGIPPRFHMKKGKKDSYHFGSPGGATPKIHMELDFARGEWRLIVDDIDASIVDSSDGVDVTLMIGYMLAGQNVPMWTDYLVYPPRPYKDRPHEDD